MTTSSIGPGTVLGGRYQLQELLSDHEGARFWRATDTVLVRSVAVHAVSSDDPRAGDLLAGARLSATVSEPRLLRVLDCDTENGTTWVINEWGTGISLDLMLQRGPLPPQRAAWLAREVADSIAAAHAQGVPHGALSPENVLITEAGAVKLIGFVVAAVLEGPVLSDTDYGNLDHREADVINVAGVLYAALTGRWPGVTPSAVPAAPREGGRPLRPRRVRAGIPRTLDVICTRVLLEEGSLHGLPIDTAHEVAAALSDYVGDPGLTAPLDLPSLHTEPTVALRLPPPDGFELSAETTGAETTGLESPAPLLPEPAAVEPETEAPEDRDEPPPPPAFEEPPERPLFASTERRRNLPPGWPPGSDQSSSPDPASQPVSTGGSGSFVPAPGYWPFTEPDSEAAASARSSGAEGRNWLQLAAVVGVCLAIVVAMAFAFRLGRDHGHPSSQPSAGRSPTQSGVSSRLPIASATAFDPEGDRQENDAKAGNAIDGRPDTSWQTVTYFNNPHLGGLKSGVGLLLDLGTDRRVGSLRLHFRGGPTSVSIYAADPGVTNPPTSLAGLRRIGSTPDAGRNTVLRVRNSDRTRFLVVWLTKLPPVAGGYRGEISELSVWS